MTRKSKHEIERDLDDLKDSSQSTLSATEAYAFLVEMVSTGEELTEAERAAYPGPWDDFIGDPS
jgi:hypothetical protein